MTRFIPVLASALLLLACEPPPPPDCTTLEVHVEDPTRDVISMLVVVDPHIPSERRAQLVEAVVSGMRVLTTGDSNADGLRDFTPVNALRLAVITSSGTLIETLPTPAPPTPRWFVPEAEGVLSVWPNTSPDWDAWFAATAAQRLQDAFAMPVEANTPSAATLGFLQAHPAFMPGSSSLVLIVTDRDEEGEGETDLTTALRAMRSTNPGRIGVALIVAAPDGTNVERGDFRALLGPQAFDEARVMCGDGSAAGRYPRRLVETLERLAGTGSSVSLESLCGEAPRLFLNTFLSDSVGRLFGACLPVALPSTEEGLVDCTATLLLPEFGGHRCADFGLTVAAVEDAGNGFVRERCVLPQVPHPPGVEPHSPPGFFYDDFTVAISVRCLRTPQRLGVTWLDLNGATLDAQCHWPTPMCLATQDAGFRDARASDTR